MPERAAQALPRVAVFAPSPALTITVEGAPGSDDEIHLHAGGQGFWVARMAKVLGAHVTFCTALGGESGAVLEGLIRTWFSDIRPVHTAGASGAYIHDRRSGEREPVAHVRGSQLQRHEADELYGAMTAAALTSDVAVLTGPEHDEVLPIEFYDRLAGDVRGNGTPVIADLTGPALDAALGGGLDLLKLSHEELGEMTGRTPRTLQDYREEIARLRERGAENVLISRAGEPALAGIGPDLFELAGPRFEPIDSHGAGDSMVAALAIGTARGAGLIHALQLAVAAGALNVTRRGLGSGRREDIERLATTVKVTQLSLA
jgi:1-phosphofructokinase